MFSSKHFPQLSERCFEQEILAFDLTMRYNNPTLCKGKKISKKVSISVYGLIYLIMCFAHRKMVRLVF